MEFLSREGGRHCFILASDKNKKRSMIAPNRTIISNDPNETQKEKRNRSKSINHKPWPFDQLVQENTCFLGGPLRWLTVQRNPKFLKIIRKIFGEQLFPLVHFVQNFFTAGFETGQPRHLSKHFSAWFSQTSWFLMYMLLYIPLEKWFAT